MTTIVDVPRTTVDLASQPPDTQPLAVRTPDTQLRVTQWRVVVSEWIKLRSLRSTVIAMFAAIVVLVGLGMLFSGITSGTIGSGSGGGPFSDPTGASLAGVNGVQLIIGVLGVLFIAGEYSTGMIRSSLAAVPKRLPVLWAKAIVFSAATFVLMTVASFAAFLGGQAVFASNAVGASLSDPGVLRAVIGASVFLTAVGLIGIALGALMRNSAAAIATLFGVVFLLPSLIGLILPHSWSDVIGPYLPGNAGAALMTVGPSDSLLSPWPGAAVLVGYLIALFAGAAILLKRRDA